MHKVLLLVFVNVQLSQDNDITVRPWELKVQTLENIAMFFSYLHLTWQPNTVRPRWVGYMSIKLFIFFMNLIKVMPLPNVNLVITTHEDYFEGSH